MRILLWYEDSGYASGDYWKKALTDLGHDVFFCGIGIQHWSSGFLRDSDALEFVREHGSFDLFIFMDGYGSFPRNVERLPMRTVCHLGELSLNPDSWRRWAPRLFDLALVISNKCTSFLDGLPPERVGISPFACCPEVHWVPGLERKYDVAFVGQTSGPHKRRNEFVRRLQQRHPNSCIVAGPIPPEMGRIYSQSKMVFNASYKSDVNMRVFEALCAGALLVTEDLPELRELFTPGEHLVVYQDLEEVFDLIDYYLAHDAERERMAQRGQEVVLAQHTYRHRAQAMLERVMSLSPTARGALSQEERDMVYALIYEGTRINGRAIEHAARLLRSSPAHPVGLRVLTKSLLRRLKYLTSPEFI